MEGDCWTNISDEAKSLIRNLLSMAPENRLTAEQALSHPWLVDSYKMVEVQPELVRGLPGFNGIAKLATGIRGRIVGKCESVRSRRIESVCKTKDDENVFGCSQNPDFKATASTETGYKKGDISEGDQIGKDPERSK